MDSPACAQSSTPKSVWVLNRSQAIGSTHGSGLCDLAQQILDGLGGLSGYLILGAMNTPTPGQVIEAATNPIS